MNVFISWSGDHSRNVALALKSWLPDVLHYVRTWMSDQDISPGKKSAIEMGEELQRSDFGILCLTPDNLLAPWVLFEAGALSKMFYKAHVVPYLFGLETTDVGPPLSQFQSVRSDRDGTQRLVNSINEKLDEPLSSDRMKRTFDRCWPDLEERLSAISEEVSTEIVRKDRDLLEEILTQVRSLTEVSSELRALVANVSSMPSHESDQKVIMEALLEIIEQLPEAEQSFDINLETLRLSLKEIESRYTLSQDELQTVFPILIKGLKHGDTRIRLHALGAVSKFSSVLSLNEKYLKAIKRRVNPLLAAKSKDVRILADTVYKNI
jgi:hypothetical protein